MKFSLKPILIGVTAGLVVGLSLFGIVALGLLGASENAYLARVLFPYAAANFSARDWVVLSLFLLQYPLYGALLGIVGNQVRQRKLVLAAILALLASGHLTAVKAAHRADAVWVESQTWE